MALKNNGPIVGIGCLLNPANFMQDRVPKEKRNNR